MPFSFEALEVYEKAISFGARALELAKRFPDDYAALTRELCKTAISVSSGIAHGGGTWNKSEKKQLFFGARGSCLRCAAILSVSKSLGLIKDSDLGDMNEEIEVLSKMLSKLAQSTDRDRAA